MRTHYASITQTDVAEHHPEHAGKVRAVMRAVVAAEDGEGVPSLSERWELICDDRSCSRVVFVAHMPVTLGHDDRDYLDQIA